MWSDRMSLILLQRHVNQTKEKQADKWTQLDPAQDARATREWAHLIHDCDIADLRNTHNSLATTFRTGRHCGQTVEGLTAKMVSGDIL